MIKTFAKALLIPVALTGVMAAAPTSAHEHHSEQLNTEMKNMGFNFRRATRAESTEELQKYVSQFKTHAENARKAGLKNAPEDFQKGINELLAGLAKVQAAIDSGDLEQATKLMKGLNKIKEQYHDKFDV